MKKLSIQLFVGVLVVCVLVAAGLWVQSSTAARPDPASYPMKEIQSVAEQSLPLVIQGLSSAPGDYHFTDSSEVQRITLGPPIMIYGLNQTTLDVPFAGNARTYVLPLRDNYGDFPQLSAKTQSQMYPLEDVLPLIRAHIAIKVEQNKQQGTAVPLPPTTQPLYTPLPTKVYPTVAPSTPTTEPVVRPTVTPQPAYPAP